MNKARFDSTERLGVNAVEKIFLQFNWIPRTVFQTDVGLDMLVEICTSGNPTGHFIGVQIKSGDSYFKEKRNNSVVFRPKSTHVDYWINNSLPILIVLHNPQTEQIIWQVVSNRTIESTGRNFKLKIPLTNNLEKRHSFKIEKLTVRSPLLNQFQKLLLDQPIINLLKNYEKVVVDIGICYKDSSGKANIRVFHVTSDKEIRELNEGEEYNEEEEDGRIEQRLIHEFSSSGVRSYQSLYYFYKWANFKLDESFYETFSNYSEGEEPSYKIVFYEDKYSNIKLSVIPYKRTNGIAYYRLKMSLNEYGFSINDFMSFLGGEKQFELAFD
jgi:hypothetical protein